MNSIKQFMCRKRGGVALIISFVFVLIFSVLAVCLATMSGTNVQISENQRKSNRALTSAQSGHEFLRFWLTRIHMPGTITPNDRFSETVDYVEADLATAGIGITRTNDGGGSPIIMDIDNVTTNSTLGQYFSAQIQPINIDILQMDVTGTAGNVKQIIRVNYNFGTRAHKIFDYGIATKGPLNLSGNIDLTGENVIVDSSVYIESDVSVETLAIIGNSQIAGECYFSNPDADIYLQGGQASIGGETGDAALDHCHIVDDPVGFPVPIPGYFGQYVQNTFDPNNILTEYENVKIPFGTNPVFSADTTFKGVVYIEVPNLVRFEGHVDITGIIVGDGDLNDDSGTNRIDFLGTVSSHPVTDLPETEPQFEQLRNETGTFLMAPGFGVSFGGNFDTLNGCIAANGVNFFGDAGGAIDGSILNYSDTTMELEGNSDLFFFRSGTTEVPAGFGPEIILHYDPLSYREVPLCNL